MFDRIEEEEPLPICESLQDQQQARPIEDILEALDQLVAPREVEINIDWDALGPINIREKTVLPLRHFRRRKHCQRVGRTDGRQEEGHRESPQRSGRVSPSARSFFSTTAVTAKRSAPGGIVTYFSDRFSSRRRVLLVKRRLDVGIVRHAKQKGPADDLGRGCGGRWRRERGVEATGCGQSKCSRGGGSIQAQAPKSSSREKGACNPSSENEACGTLKFRSNGTEGLSTLCDGVPPSPPPHQSDSCGASH
ncbi:hypothetical protein CEXT_786921 [Caerostris extrusa]|uniref:Uncharacterized protein n=1 Tax=Caerostris extrusa TaxID=172846 RepID=A0AAV4Y9T4_CAEEX|nr:hypothetical protein CEXT_786921 [Caerostris extrusa]